MPHVDTDPIRILVVEDDRLALAALIVGLETAGYSVAKAASGEEALLIVEAFQPQLVLMDICLPGISGFEAARQIRKKHQTAIVFLSAVEDPEMVKKTLALDATFYLVKPITLAQVMPVIESTLARARDLATLRASEENLSTALRQNREISMAVGMIMERHGLSAENAFVLLRSHARNTRSSASAVASQILAGTLNLPSGT